MTAACVGMAAIGASSGIAADSGRGSARAGSITLYSGQHEQTVSKLVADFEKRTGVKVSVRSADEATLANQIMQEGSQVAGRRLLRREPARPAGARGARAARARAALRRCAQSRARDSSPSGDWVGVSARASVLVYNTDKLASRPSSPRRCSTSRRRSGRASSRSPPARPTSSRW